MPKKNTELVLYRKTEDGGLGLYNVKIRALALLIRTFLETSINPAFKHSLFHEILFRYHVLGEVSLPDPGLPPYYNKDFFNIIRHYHTTSSLNITCMSTKDWYKTLLEDQILMTQPTEQAKSILIPTRVESVQPNNDWTETGRLAMIHGLGSNLTSFHFKLLHRLLPTQDCVQRLGVAVDGQPGLCQLCHLETEDALHALVHCPHSAVAGLALLGHAQNVLPNLSPEAALTLDFGKKLEEEEELQYACLPLGGSTSGRPESTRSRCSGTR